ncbi:TniQ family protein [Sideroxydans sp.]
MAAHLVSRPIPIPEESPASVLMRAVEGNGYPNLQSLIWAFVKNANGKVWAKASFIDPARYTHFIAELGIDMPPEVFPVASRSGPTAESDRLVDGMKIPEKLFRDDGRYFCPECLRDRKYWRKSWSLRPYSVCPIHSKFLIKDCPACGGELHSWRGKLAECACGADLRKATSESEDPAPINWWLEVHRNGESRAEAIDAALIAFCCLDGGDFHPKSEYRWLSAVFKWFAMGKVDQYAQELVDKQSHLIHPRIQLLPLLRCEHLTVQALAKAILSRCMPDQSFEVPETGKPMQALEAQLALGITRRAFTKFRKIDLVKLHPAGNGSVNLDDVNRLLFAVHAVPGETMHSVGRAQTTSLASMVLEAMSGNRVSAGYDIEQGLTTLRLSPKKPNGEADSGTNGEWLDVHQVASLFKTYPDTVRFSARKGWMLSRDRDLTGRKRLIVSRTSAEEFNRKYVFGGVLAKQLAMNPKKLLKILMALDIQAVSGPWVDGTLISLFRREDVECLDSTLLKNMSENPKLIKGKRKAISAQVKATTSDTVPAVEAAKILGIGVQQLQVLFKKSILRRSDTMDRAVMVDRVSLEKLHETLTRQDMITVAEAAARLDLLPNIFESRWVKRGAIRVFDLGWWRLVRLDDFEKLRGLLHGRVTAAEAGRMLGIHPSYFPAMERRGKVRGIKLGTKHGGVRLYKLNDVEARILNMHR